MYAIFVSQIFRSYDKSVNTPHKNVSLTKIAVFFQVKQDLKEKKLPKNATVLLSRAQNLQANDEEIFPVYTVPNVSPLIQPINQNVIRITQTILYSVIH